MEFAMTSSMNVSELRWNNTSDKISSYFAIIMLAVMIGFPFGVWYLLWRQINKLKEEESIKRFGSTYMELRTDSKAALMYNVVYMLRRLAFALTAVLLKSLPSIQVAFTCFQSLVVITYIAQVQPFELPLLNTMEIVNEFTILVATYHLFLFTDYVEDPNMQYILGWSMIGLTVLNILINMGVMVWTSFRQLKLAFL